MICRKTMEPCRTPGMCAPYSGCQPSILKEVSVRYSSESGAQVVENPAPIPDLGQFVDYVWALKAERDELRAQVEAMRELLRKVAPHFAAPPGLGHLHTEIDAALQAKP